MSPIARALRRFIEDRSKHRCGYCQTQEQIIGMPLEIEHIIPEVLGGDSMETNLWSACPSCNRHKSQSTHAVDLETGHYVPLFNPRNQLWRDHFQWIEGGLLVLGITPTGRATVETLHMNNTFVVRARRRWILAGWHPPNDT